MPTVHILDTFQRQLDRVVKKYPLSKTRIDEEIKALVKNPRQGDKYPGFGGLEVRKIRMPLTEYSIGKSKGLRLIFIVIKDNTEIVPLVIYQKKRFSSESEIKKLVMESIQEVHREIM